MKGPLIIVVAILSSKELSTLKICYPFENLSLNIFKILQSLLCKKRNKFVFVI